MNLVCVLTPQASQLELLMLLLAGVQSGDVSVSFTVKEEIQAMMQPSQMDTVEDDLHL